MADFSKLTQSILKKAEAVEKNATKVVRETAITIGTTIISATPVDTGYARSNWFATINNASLSTVDDFNQSGDKAIKQIADKAKQYTNNDTSIHITNNVNYIGDLNRGTSKQAPANFVQIAIETAVEEVKRVRLLDGR